MRGAASTRGRARAPCEGDDPALGLARMLRRLDEIIASCSESRLSAAAEAEAHGAGGRPATPSPDDDAEMELLRGAVERAPDIREDVVGQVRDEVLRGSVRVDAQRISDAILCEFVQQI